MLELFVPQRLANKSERLLKVILDILERYKAMGLSLSVRQLYYQCVVINAVKNNHQEYKRVVDLVSNARLGGRIDWDAIVDRARNSTRPRNWTSPADAVKWVQSMYQIDKWVNQPWHVEVMVEKQALEGVLEPVCSELDVTFTANKGYTSQSMAYETGKRLAFYRAKGKRILVCYLGDHDPSGLDMTRDITERLSLFTRKDFTRHILPDVPEAYSETTLNNNLVVQRLALNMHQVTQYNPPENPAKQTDSRSQGYIDQYGESSWELDALDPFVLAELLRTAILSVRDESLWTEAVAEETKQREELSHAVDRLKGNAAQAKYKAKRAESGNPITKKRKTTATTDDESSQ